MLSREIGSTREMTVKELFLITFGMETDLPEEISNENALFCSCVPYSLDVFESPTVEFPEVYGLTISISTEKHEVKAKLEFNKIVELSINDVTP
jgi:hypothetical protein